MGAKLKKHMLKVRMLGFSDLTVTMNASQINHYKGDSLFCHDKLLKFGESRGSLWVAGLLQSATTLKMSVNEFITL